MHRTSHTDADGFTLLETVVATGVLVTALAGIAQLLALSVRTTYDAGSQAAALMAAQDKLEGLRSLALTYDPLGAPVTDAGLAASANFTLDEDTDGFVDYVDRDGATVDTRVGGHGATLTRRWRITPIDPFVPEALAIEVCVFRWPSDGVSLQAATACLATVRVRQP